LATSTDAIGFMAPPGRWPQVQAVGPSGERTCWRAISSVTGADVVATDMSAGLAIEVSPMTTLPGSAKENSAQAVGQVQGA